MGAIVKVDSAQHLSMYVLSTTTKSLQKKVYFFCSVRFGSCAPTDTFIDEHNFKLRAYMQNEFMKI